MIVAFGALEGPPEDLHALNGTATVATLAEAAERLRRQGHGTLVLISSVAADRPRPSNYAYGSSKAAADDFAQGLGDALHGSGVEVLIVRPGFVRTKMTAHLDSAPLSVDAAEVGRAVAGAVRRGRPVTYVPAPMRLVSLVLQALPQGDPAPPAVLIAHIPPRGADRYGTVRSRIFGSGHRDQLAA